MTRRYRFHRQSKQPARGSRDHRNCPKICISFPEEMFETINTYAVMFGMPFGQAVRDYCQIAIDELERQANADEETQGSDTEDETRGSCLGPVPDA